MVTMRKIAEIAKVSRGTVDKVLNNRPGVSDEVRKRVMEIAEALNYRPNVIGKALANQRKSFLIGVIVPPDTNPYFDDIKRGIYAAYEEVRIAGKDHLPGDEEPRAERAASSDRLPGRQGISALTLNPINSTEVRDAIDRLVEQRIPVVTFTSDILESKRLCFVGLDVVKSGASLAS